MEEGQAASRRRSTAVPVVLVAGALMTVSVFIFLGLVTFEDEQGRGLRALAASSIDATALPQTVPFRNVGGHLVVEAVIAGSVEPRPMLLDTGAPSFLSIEIADSDVATPSGTLAVVSASGEVIETEVVSVPSLGLGGATFSDVGAVRGFVGPRSPLYCLSRHGMVGASLMHDAVWQLDYPFERLTIAASSDDLDHIEGAIEMPFSAAEGASPSPVVELRVGDTTLPFLVDTGSDGWLAVHPADLEAAGVAVPADAPTITTLAADTSGDFLAELRWTSADVVLGKGDAELSLPDLPIVTTSAIPEGQGIMGNGLLSGFVVTVDWPGEVIHLDPVGGEPSPPAPPSAAITWDGSDLIVGSVVRGIPAYEGAVVVNAQVLEVDGEDVADATLDEACGLLTGDVPQTFELTLLTDGEHTVDVFAVDDFFEPLASD